MKDQQDVFFSRENIGYMLNYIMKVIVLYLGLNFEKKLFEVYVFEFNYLIFE